jgi:type I restriction enzyme R subunit
LRSDITTQALAEKGWAVMIDEREENYKIKDLERKIFVPERNRIMCEAFLKHAQTDPSNRIGKSIIFAVNQDHATAITKMLNEMQPGLAVTITSRIKDAADIAKDFRDGKRSERVAASVDMLSTGYNCKDLLNVVLMRPIFSPTEYIQVKGRGTRRFTFRVGNTEYEKQKFFLIDFCAVAEYFEERYDYSAPLAAPSEGRRASAEGGLPATGQTFSASTIGDRAANETASPSVIPVWEGKDIIISEDMRIVGPEGEKVDVMTFRGSFERDISAFAKKDAPFQEAVQSEDDDSIESILQERFFHKSKMFYSPKKLVASYGVPATPSAFVYNALGKKNLPTKDSLVTDTVDSISSRFNLRYSDQKWLQATAHLVADDPGALKRFMEGDMTLFSNTQFNRLGGFEALTQFSERDAVFEALRQSSFVRQSIFPPGGGL